MSLFKRNYRDVRRGMTIVELLVVLGVLSILLGIAATAVKTGTRGKKQREAARQVNAYIAAAQAKAVQLNRPVGIEIARNLTDANQDGVYASGTDTGISNASLLMYTIETPPPYAGDNVSARIGITVPMGYGPGSTITLDDTSTLNYVAGVNLMNVNDLVGVRLNYRGPIYSGTVASNSPLQITFQIPAHDRSFFDLGTVPCQIFLPPERTSATPLQLPSDMCIDLTCSGVANTGNEFANWAAGTNDLSIRFLFSPRGNVQSVNYNGLWLAPTGNIHMLVGKYDQAVDALEVMGTDGINEVATFPPGTPVNYVNYLTPSDPDLDTNLADATAMWVSVNFLTGQITTTRNKLIQDSFLTDTAFTALSQAAKNQAILAEARDFARRVLIVKGQGDN